MIPRYVIQQWKKNAPWQSDSQVEHDLILTRAIISLYQNPIIQKGLAFRGGTALNKLYINPPARYSEDLDFVLINDAPVGEIMSAIRMALDPWLGKARWDQTEKYVKLYYRFESEESPSRPLRLKIEINAYEIFSVFGHSIHPITVDNDWFTGNANLTSYTLDELMGTKLRALYQRSKGRDIFDLWLALEKLQATPQNILHAFQEYNSSNSQIITRAQFEMNLFYKELDSSFCKDINALLPINFEWNIKHAFKTVQELLIRNLPGNSWKGEKMAGVESIVQNATVD